MDTDPQVIAAKLTRGQKSTIANLDENPATLGCAEATAKRLSKPTTRRPALTVSTRNAKTGWDDYALSAAGIAVKVYC